MIRNTIMVRSIQSRISPPLATVGTAPCCCKSGAMTGNTAFEIPARAMVVAPNAVWVDISAPSV